MPTVKKLPKWAIKQAGGINKKAWALARRGKGRKMSRAKRPKAAKRPKTRRSHTTSHGSHTSNNRKGYGSWFKLGRTADVFSGPGQGAIQTRGATKEGGMEALRRYSAGMSEGAYDSETAKDTYGGIGTGLLRNWIRSKMGVYRGVGQKKALSIVMAANPEILATGEVNPGVNLPAWNNVRSGYDRSYFPLENFF